MFRHYLNEEDLTQLEFLPAFKTSPATCEGMPTRASKLPCVVRAVSCMSICVTSAPISLMVRRQTLWCCSCGRMT